ncbi:nucleotide sugar dehydrogenase [Thermovibrio ammonificans]
MERKPKVAVIGMGYVGIVGAVCLAKMGHEVVGVDVNERKISMLKEGKLPIYETDLDKYFNEVKNKLTFTTDTKEAVKETELCFVCVGTPPRPDGEVDLSYVKASAEAIGEGLKEKEGFYTVVYRSTIPPGTSHNLIIPTIEKHSGKKRGKDFGYAFNPEFLREGTAIYDFFNPPKTVVGTEEEEVAQLLFDIYKELPEAKIKLPIVESEMVKYVDNVWHAIKVAFANEVGYFAKRHGADGRLVMEVFCKDRKLNLSPYYLKPGFAFGGSCLPKDVKGFVAIAREKGIEIPLIEHVMPSNRKHVEKAKKMVEEVVPKTESVTIVGLTFKPGTDDVRESSAVYLAKELQEAGYTLNFYDPLVKREHIEGYFGKGFIDFSKVKFLNSPEETFKEKNLVLTGSFKEIPQEPEAYEGKRVFDLNGLLYKRNDLIERCEYYGMCW